MAASIMYDECVTLCIVWYILLSDVAVIESEGYKFISWDNTVFTKIWVAK